MPRTETTYRHYVRNGPGYARNLTDAEWILIASSEADKRFAAGGRCNAFYVWPYADFVDTELRGLRELEVSTAEA